MVSPVIISLKEVIFRSELCNVAGHELLADLSQFVTVTLCAGVLFPYYNSRMMSPIYIYIYRSLYLCLVAGDWLWWTAMRRHCTCSLFKRVLVAAVYMTVIVVQLYLWPICDVSLFCVNWHMTPHTQARWRLWCESHVVILIQRHIVYAFSSN